MKEGAVETLPPEDAGRAEIELRPITADGEGQSLMAEGEGPSIVT